MTMFLKPASRAGGRTIAAHEAKGAQAGAETIPVQTQHPAAFTALEEDFDAH